MQLTLSEKVLAEYLSGLIAIAALLVLGCLLAFILKKIIRKQPFIRLSLILTLTPLSLIHFLGRNAVDTLYLYAMVVIPLGIAIDGIHFLIRQYRKSEQQETEEEETESENAHKKDDVIIWKRAK